MFFRQIDRHHPLNFTQFSGDCGNKGLLACSGGGGDDDVNQFPKGVRSAESAHTLMSDPQMREIWIKTIPKTSPTSMVWSWTVGLWDEKLLSPDTEVFSVIQGQKSAFSLLDNFQPQ